MGNRGPHFDALHLMKLAKYGTDDDVRAGVSRVTIQSQR